MNRALRRESGKSALDLMEEATQLLRTAPAGTAAVYYTGAIPFVLGLLYFWTEMSSSPFASGYLAEGALVMTALFIWMKFCQAWFARRIRAQLTNEPMPVWKLRQIIRILVQQAVIQPSGLFIIPLAALVMLPFGWVYAFYQNVTALADADADGASAVVRKAWKQASLWTLQNHLLITVVLAFGLFVLMNWIVISFMLPGLIKMFFGIETVFSQSPLAMLNTTFFTAVFALTYLFVDPIVKTAYSLRCFYGESLQSGEDLKAELKQFSRIATPLAAAITVLMLCHAGSIPAEAQPAALEPQSSVSAAELDGRIEEIIREDKYAWRMPHEVVDEPSSADGVVTKFIKQVVAIVRDAFGTVSEWIEEIFRRLFRSDRAGSGRSSGLDWVSSNILLLSLLIVAAAAVVIVAVRSRRRRNSPAMQAEAVLQPVPDVSSDNVSADQLPEDAWTKLARDLLARGELRLAMRAMYLASLAHLAQRNLIAIARFKSNRDYENELRRRSHAVPELAPLFRDNISMFERIWYGNHEPDPRLVEDFSANVDRIKATV